MNKQTRIGTWARLLAPVALTGLLAACGGSSDLGEEDVATHLHVLNLVDDSPSLQFYLDTTVVATAGYGSGAAYSAAPAGTRSVHLAAVRPTRLAGDTGVTTPIDIGTPVNEVFSDANDYTVIGVGTMASPQTFVVSATDQRSEVAATKFSYRIVHASPTGAGVDVYITAPEAGISTPTFVSSLVFKGTSTQQELTLVAQPNRLSTDEALYVNLVVELRAAGTNTVLFNSGKLFFNEKTRALLAIANNTSGRGSPFQLIALGQDGNGSVLHDVNDPSAVRLVNLSRDSLALDLLRPINPQQAIATNIPFGGVSPRPNTPSGAVDLVATQTGNPAAFVFISELTALRSQGYSTYAVGPAASVDGVVLADNQRSVPTQAQFRFLHAAGSLSSDTGIDIYVTLQGKALDFNPDDDSDTTDNAATLRQVSGLAYRASSGYVALPEASYDVYFARTGTSTVLLGPVTVQFLNGSSRTLALTDSLTSTLELRTINDVVN